MFKKEPGSIYPNRLARFRLFSPARSSQQINPGSFITCLSQRSDVILTHPKESCVQKRSRGQYAQTGSPDFDCSVQLDPANKLTPAPFLCVSGPGEELIKRSGRDSAIDLIDDLCASKQLHRWNRANGEALRELRVLVDVDLDDAHATCALARRARKRWLHGAARPAPRRPEIDQHWNRTIFDQITKAAVGRGDERSVKDGCMAFPALRVVGNALGWYAVVRPASGAALFERIGHVRTPVHGATFKMVPLAGKFNHLAAWRSDR